MRAAALLLAVLAASCTNEPTIGPWSSLDVVVETPEHPALKAEFAKARAEVCIPKASELSLPVFPEVEAYDVDWSKRPPHCGSVAVPGDRRVELILFSKRSPDEVKAWYATRLSAFGRHEPEQDSVLFMEELPANFSWKRDWRMTRKARFVTVNAFHTRYPAIAALGYRTLIEIGDPGPKRD